MKIEQDISSLKKSDGTYTETLKETIEYLMKYIFPKDILEEEDELQRNIRCVGETTDTSNDPQFTENEIKYAVDSQRNKKAAGFQKLKAEIIKITYKIIPEIINKLFNSCLKIGYFPKLWKVAVLKLLRKSNKPLDLPSSYRPICLLPVLGKVYEKLLMNRINWLHESKKMSSSKQFGFREHKSTEQAVNRIVNLAKRQLNHKK